MNAPGQIHLQDFVRYTKCCAVLAWAQKPAVPGKDSIPEKDIRKYMSDGELITT